MRCDPSSGRCRLALLALSSALVFFGSHSAQGAPEPISPHAQQMGRQIKALSPQEVEGLLSGQGMGLALAAELNGYPGPMHVLELAAELGLTHQQHAAAQEVFDDMHTRAQELGHEIVGAERRLDDLFASGEATPGELQALVAKIGALRADLRHAHLAAHLETRALLTEEQVHRYIHLRGYGGHGEHAGHGGHSGHRGHSGHGGHAGHTGHAGDGDDGGHTPEGEGSPGHSRPDEH